MENSNHNINDNLNDSSQNRGGEVSSGVNTYQKSAFGGNVFYTLAQRAERVTTAVYMVSNFVSSDRTLQSDMRRHGLRVVKDLYKCITCDAYDQQFYLEEVLVSIEYIVTTMNIAHVTGSISEMNKSVLEKALRNIGSQVYAQLQIALRYDQSFSNNIAPVIDKETLLDFLQETVDPDNAVTEGLQQVLQEAISVKKTFKKTQNDTYLKRQTKRHSKSKEATGGAYERREKIRAIIADKGDTTIKDIATRITNCSEKTLQRDLVSLIKDNLIEKEGDKRWSVYRIKDSSQNDTN